LGKLLLENEKSRLDRENMERLVRDLISTERDLGESYQVCDDEYLDDRYREDLEMQINEIVKELKKCK
jgi:hypothetical protein